MKLIAALTATFVSSSAIASQLELCPTDSHRINLDGHTTLKLWGVPGITPLTANPDNGWPTEASVVMWWKTLREARNSGKCVTIFYNPNPDEAGNDIWSITD